MEVPHLSADTQFLKWQCITVAMLEGDQGDRQIPLKFGRLLEKVKNWDFVSDMYAI